MELSRSRRLVCLFFFCELGVEVATAQPFEINSVTVSNGVVAVHVPTRSDSYYILQSKQKLTGSSSFSPTNFMLGNGGNLAFAQPMVRTGAMYFGIPDGWKLLQGLNPLTPGVGTNLAIGYAATWSQVYQRQTNLAALPVAYFPNSSSMVVVGATNFSVPIALTKPYTGWVTYQLSGTALPQSSSVTGDYVAPNLQEVFLNNATSANITIKLVPETDIEINRSIVIALTAPPLASQTSLSYAIATNSCVTTVQLVQSTQGLYIGALTISNGLFSGSQSVKLALRPGTGGSTLALLDVTGNALLGNTFTIPVSTNSSGFQLNGDQTTTTVTNTPWGRNLSVSLAFGITQFTNTSVAAIPGGGPVVSFGSSFITPVTLSIGGLTASGLTYSGSGTLNLSQAQ